MMISRILPGKREALASALFKVQSAKRIIQKNALANASRSLSRAGLLLNGNRLFDVETRRFNPLLNNGGAFARSC